MAAGGGALPHRSLRDLARRHGAPAVMSLRLGAVPAVVVSSAAAARDVLRTHDADCCSRPDTAGPRRLSYEHNDVAFSPYSERWRERRRLMVAEFLSKRRIQDTWYAREAEVDKLISRLESAGREQPVVLEEHVFAYMDHLAYRKEQFHRVIDEAMVVRSSFTAEDYFPNALGRLADRLFTGAAALRERVFRDFDAFFEMMLQHHLDHPKPNNGNNGGCGLIDVLIGLMKEHKFSRDAVKALLTNTFIGAVDTGAVTIVWAMAELVRHPHLLKKAQDEVRAVVGDDHNKDRVDPDAMPKLRYLRMVVKETLRLHPALPLLVLRETLRDITVAGYDVPARTRVLVNAWAIGRDPATWERPEEFDPGRFDGEEEVGFSRARFEFLPFGAGRRMCPGIDMGVATTEFTLANLLYCFDWELPDGVGCEDVCMEEAGGLTVHKKTPLLLVPTRYKCQR
ncbi:unnamed protein product [Urochloa humidicola]